MTREEAALAVDKVLCDLVDDIGCESDEMSGEDWEEGQPVFPDRVELILKALNWSENGTT